jgi:hypothetical protein
MMRASAARHGATQGERVRVRSRTRFCSLERTIGLAGWVGFGSRRLGLVLCCPLSAARLPCLVGSPCLCARAAQTLVSRHLGPWEASRHRRAVSFRRDEREARLCARLRVPLLAASSRIWKFGSATVHRARVEGDCAGLRLRALHGSAKLTGNDILQCCRPTSPH